MLQKSLAIALILLMIAPLNVGASAVMAMSMVDGGHWALAAGDHKSAPRVGHKSESNLKHHDEYSAGHQPHGLSTAKAESHGLHANHTDAHDQHSEEDCQEYCMSCSNHCSSLAVLSSHAANFTQARVLSAASIGVSSNHSDLLLRPPISA